LASVGKAAVETDEPKIETGRTRMEKAWKYSLIRPLCNRAAEVIRKVNRKRSTAVLKESMTALTMRGTICVIMRLTPG